MAMTRRRRAEDTPETEAGLQFAEIERALTSARRNLRARIAVGAFASTYFVPALLGAAWIALARFTLLEIPRWPVLVAPLAWFVVWWAWVSTRPVSRRASATYLDRALGLDERISTLLELDGRVRAGLATAAASFRGALLNDTVELLRERYLRLPSPLRLRMNARYALVGALACALLVGAIFVPTGLDAVRAERSQLRQALTSQADKIASLRAEIVQRPEIPPDLKGKLDEQLAKLEQSLRAEHRDRSEALLQLAASEEGIRGLLPGTAAADFDALVRAAQLIQQGAVSSTDWDPSESTAPDDLGRGAEAADHARAYYNQFTATESRGMAAALERAASIAVAKDGELGQALQDAANTLRRREQPAYAASLTKVAAALREAQKGLQSARAVETALSKIEDARDSVAKTGAPVAKKPQVGFRRPSANATATAPAAAAAQGTPTDAAGSGSTGSQSTGPRIGQNQPAFGTGPQSGGAANPSAPQTGSGSQSGGTGAGQTSGAAKPAGSGDSQASGGGPGGTGQSGAVQGVVRGPVRVGGAQSGGGGAQGQGVGTSSAQTGGAPAPAERLYIPGQSGAERSGVGGQASPAPNTTGVAGRVGSGEGEQSTASGPGLGQLDQIRTPYTEVLGQYAQQATENLERTYVPQDAREYVKLYFEALGR
jgi:hypothetical protein